MRDESSLDAALISEFIDDYYAECDEHLTAVRSNLLILEAYIGQPVSDRALLDALLRAFHSIKGLSGMVGMGEAEQLAHEVESALRSLRENQNLLTTDLYSALVAATTAMEQIIGARRTGQPGLDLAPVIAHLSGPDLKPGQAPAESDTPTTESEEGADLEPHERTRLQAALARGERVWKFTFVSSPDLAQRNVNVNTVRARLEQVGELIRARPQVVSGGRVSFAFLVASMTDESTFRDWQTDGVTYEPYNVTPAPVSASSSAAAATPREPHEAVAPSNIVRVDLARLDELMQHLGELIIVRARLAAQLQEIESLLPAAQWRALQETDQLLQRQLRDLREAGMRVRLVPIGEVFARMQFVIRDLARASQKRVVLDVSGQETEIDKLVVERMMDPLLHLVRNAVSHGLERPEERVRCGKPSEGRIALAAATEGDMVIIRVADDGHGIDLDQVTRRGRESGLLRPDEVVEADHLLDILCAPGFSTRTEADLGSGRGVGMAVVQRTVQELGGTLAVQSKIGLGTSFTVRLPLTLAIMDALIVSAGGQTFAVPQLALREIIEVPANALRPLDGAGHGEVMVYRNGALPTLRLSRLFGLRERGNGVSYALVTSVGGKMAGIVVDRVRSQREIVVRAIADPLVQVPGVAGATELGDGRPVLILDPAALFGMQQVEH